MMQGFDKEFKIYFFSRVFLKDVSHLSSSFPNFTFYVYLLFLRLSVTSICVSEDEKCLFIQFSEGKCQINAKSISLYFSCGILHLTKHSTHIISYKKQLVSKTMYHM